MIANKEKVGKGEEMNISEEEMKELSKHKEAISSLLDSEIGEYGIKFKFGDDEEALDYGCLTVSFDQKGYSDINIRVFDPDDEDPGSSEFEVELGEDSWCKFTNYSWEVKYLWMAMLYPGGR